MNDHFDPLADFLCYIDSVSKSDQARIADAVLVRVGPVAPIPVFADVREDALWWSQTTDLQTQIIFMAEMWGLWPRQKQLDCIEWMQANVKEAEKAEPRSG